MFLPSDFSLPSCNAFTINGPTLFQSGFLLNLFQLCLDARIWCLLFSFVFFTASFADLSKKNKKTHEETFFPIALVAFTVTPATIIAPPIVITTGPTPGIEKLPAKKPNGPVKATLLDCIEFPFNSSLLFFNWFK